MRLKSLEIKGFKSFADKTVVNFDEAITGIVGPNGCGKSNIVDSIRWVIGEQKISHLRSENLDSLVFNGSKTRSGSGLAEVSLTFENTKNLLPVEFSTITVTRKFFRNGESEYRLNDVHCRLKDIQNLFLDTGVSTDSYSIIELGMVDDIIKDKENSRRRMLEQAAGISIYKTRRKEAAQKLDATEQDLARIEDLLFEINNQLKIVESQAKKAEKYHDIRKEYRELSIELAKASMEGFNLTYRDLTAQTEAETIRKQELEQAINQEDAELEEEKRSFEEKEKELQEFQHAFNNLQQQVRTKENEKNLAAQQVKFLHDKQENLQRTITKNEEQLQRLSQGMETAGQQIGEEEKKEEGLRVLFQEKKTAAEQKRTARDERRQAVDAARQENAARQRSQFEAEKKVAVAEASCQNLQRSISQIREERNARDTQLHTLEQEQQVKEEQAQTKKAALQHMQEEQEEIKRSIAQKQEEQEKLRQQLAVENRQYDAKKNEHDLLKSMVDSMEGYPESVKFLHKNSSWNTGAPLLTDLIYVQHDYRTALESVLEPYLNYYVVSNLEEGMRAVALLDQHKRGKANFFLLDRLEHGGAPDLTQHPPVDTIPAMQVVEVDEKYRKLAEVLLGNVFIAVSAEALEQSNGAVILEKEGKFVKGPYYLTGGSIGKFEGKRIGRAKNLQKLREEISALEAAVTTLKGEIQTGQQAMQQLSGRLKDQHIRQLQQEINAAEHGLISIKNKLENLHSFQETSLKRLQELEQNLASALTAAEQTGADSKQLAAQFKQTGEKLQAVEQEYRTIDADYNQANTQYNDINLQLTRQQSRTGSIRQEYEFKNRQMGELTRQIETDTAQLRQVQHNMEENAVLLDTVQQVLTALTDSRETEEKKLKEADQAYYKQRNRIHEKEGNLRQKTKSREQVEYLLGAIKDRLNELKLRLAGTKERLLVEFRIELDDIMEQPRTGKITLEELQEKTDKIKKRIDNMGEINTTAIEAFQEMKKRYEFIVEQKNDLVSAKDSLLLTIAEVESTANQQFLHTFEQVKENFQKVFKALFTEEDTADISLENPDNLAETSIDIIAKPKGKRPSSINQLSGGEKTLTATALLFAIYLIKPAPFCILDEVDAPLDDANVGKFTKMIRQFSNESQFIIITHNKMTMSSVDVIYGVTMQEAGVSKLVPVDFRGLN